MNTQASPVQFNLRAIFALTAMVAVIVAAVRFGGLVGTLLAVCTVAAVTLVWASRTDRDRIVLVCVVVLGLSTVTALAVWATPTVRINRNRISCHNNLKQIGLALCFYYEKHGRFPPAVVYDANGKPMHSWRTLILPEIEEGPLYKQYNFNEPWDSPYNKKVTQVQISVLHCPEDKKIGQFDTNYVALIGPDSIWSGKKGAKPDEVTDGHENTLVVIEMKNSGIHWAEPRDLDLDNLPPGIDKNKVCKSLSPHVKGIVAVYADGHVETIPSDVTVDELKSAVSKSGGDRADFEKSRKRIEPIPAPKTPPTN